MRWEIIPKGLGKVECIEAKAMSIFGKLRRWTLPVRRIGRKEKDNAEALGDAETRGGIREAEQRRRVFTTEFAEGTEKGESVKSRRDHSAALRMI